MERTSTKAAALEYAARGWAVLPTKPKKKIPSTVHGVKDATTDRATISDWYDKAPARGVAIATGSRSGIIVIDIDNHNADGLASLHTWEAEHGKLPTTLEQTTGSGGRQLLYAYDGPPLPLYANGAAGIDFRGEDGYIVAPPSIHPNGNPYKWNNAGADLTPANSTVLAFIEGFRPHKPQAGKGSGAYMFDDDYEPFSLPAEIPEGQRVDTLVRYVASMRAACVPPKMIKAAVEDANQTRCAPPLPSNEIEAEVLPAIRNLNEGEPRTRSATADEIESIVEELHKLDAAKRYELNDKGTSKLYSDLYASKHRFCPQWKKWANYDGARWCRDLEGLAARNDVKKLSDALMIYAPTAGLNEDQSTRYRKYVASLGSYKNRKNIIDDARDNTPLNADKLDTDPLLLNVINGTLDLHAAPILRPHNPDDLISMVAQVAYDPDARCPVWDRYLLDALENDAGKIRYLQKFAGLCLTGIVAEETMVILYGETTRNGKSTFVETLKTLTGDYSASIEPETIAMKKKGGDGGRAREDIARLAGIRYVSVSEPDRSMLFDSATVKNFTGRDTIAARHIFEGVREFTPVFKILMNTNYLPQINDDTVFESGRINVVTFNRHYDKTTQDKGLKDHLQEPAELSGILNWCLEGLRLYRAEGLTPPETVTAATGSYREESDKVGNFIAECLVPSGANKNTAGTAAYARYQSWCRNSGHAIESRPVFYGLLRRHNLLSPTGTVDGNTTHNVLKGYELVNEFDF